MEYRIKLNLVPVSLNNAIGFAVRGNRVHSYKTKALKEFLQIAREEICEYKNVVDDFKAVFNPNIHAVFMRITFYMDNVLTKSKKKRLNLKSKDTTNCIKYTEDFIADTFGFDDALVTDVLARKRQSDKNYISIKLNIVSIKDIA